MTAPGRLLIVEDNRALAENIGEILEDIGYEVLLAHDAETALRLLDEQTFDGMITDLRLPGISGIDLITHMRGEGRRIPVAVITAFAESSTVEHAEQAGALEVLPKPVDFDRLFRVVSEFVRSDRQVLVLEDSEPLAQNIAEALEQRQMTPIVAATVHAALTQRGLPSVAIVDLRLPDGSGLDAVRRLHARDPSLRVLVTTGYPEDLEAQAAIRDLACIEAPILQKPFDLQQLLERIESATARCRSQKHS